MESVQIQKVQQGYLKRLKGVGVQATAAHPWKERQVVELLQFFNAEMARVEGAEQVVVIRDAFLVTSMWETQCRGVNAGSWRLENLRVPGGTQLSAEHYAPRLLS
jgi:hypothetical protein